MGYGSYEVIRKDGQTIMAGYLHEGPCEKKDCSEITDRGLDGLCGNEPGGGETGCGGYFCPDHISYDNQCNACAEKIDNTEETPV